MPIRKHTILYTGDHLSANSGRNQNHIIAYTCHLRPWTRDKPSVAMEKAAYADAARYNDGAKLSGRNIDFKVAYPAKELSIPDTDDVLFSQFRKCHAIHRLVFMILP